MDLPHNSGQDADNRRSNESDKRQRNMGEIEELNPKRRNSDLHLPPRERQFHSGPMVPSEYDTLTRRLHHESSLLSRQGIPSNTGQHTPRCSYKGGAMVSFTPTMLLSPSQQHPPGMSFVDAMICQNVELFQSNEEYDCGQNTGYVGLRCIHCARSGRTGLDRTSTIYPSSVELMESGLRAIAKDHFLHCVMLPESIRVEFHNHEVRRALDDNEHERRMKLNNEEALNQYCMYVCSRLNIINRMPSSSGIVIGTVKYSSPVIPSRTFLSGVTADQQSRVERDDRSLEDSALSHSQWHRRSRDHTYHNIPDSFQVRRNSSDMGTSMNIPNAPPPSLQLLPRQSISIEQPLGSSEGVSRTVEGIPFIQTAKNIWECKFCSNSPIGYRAPKHAWYSATPPDKSFMDEHLIECRGNTQSELGTASLSGRSRVNQIQSLNHIPYHAHPVNNQYYGRNQYLHSDESNQYTHPSQNWETSWRPSRDSELSLSQQHLDRQQLLSSGRTSTLDRLSVRAHSLPLPSYNRPYDELSETKLGRRSSLRGGHSNLDVTNQWNRHQGNMATTSVPKKEDFDAAIKILAKASSSTPSELANENGFLVEEADRHLITDYFYHVMRQIRTCSFEEKDRKTRGGKQNNIEIGFKGLACIHCSHTTNARRFFWSNVDLLSNSFSEIPGHILRCKACPKSTKDALLELKKHNHSQITEMPRGSQKTFLRRVWRRLHDESNKDDNQTHDETDIQPSATIVTVGSDSPDRHQATTRTHSAQLSEATSLEKAAKALKDGTSSVLLAIDQDKNWGLTDLDCLVRKNIELFCASDHDVATENRTRVSEDHKIFTGQVGLRCIHCSASPNHVTHCTYPHRLNDIFPNVVRSFKKRHLLVCPCLPQDLKEKFVSMKETSPTSYGSIVREYFCDAAKALGVRDNESGGIVATGVSETIIKGG